jgi:PAS domain S-box-containing protein
LVPYFKAGLENNEFCLWITSNPVSVEDAFEALKASVPHIDQYLQKKSIEILPHTEWYLKPGKFNGKEVSNMWIEKCHDALARGYEGMRVNGNETWLESGDWAEFMNFEREMNNTLRNLPIIVICTYSITNVASAALLDVAHIHDSVVSKRNGRWEILEKPDIKRIKAQVRQRSDELEKLVAERTHELAALIEQLQKEISERKEAEERLKKEKELSQTIKESFPGIFKIIDEGYKILAWNRMFEVITGYTAREIPHLHVLNDLHHISDRKKAFKLLQEGFARGTVNGDFRIQTKDGRILEVFFIGQQIYYEGKSCLIICGIDITERKQAEEKLRQSESLLAEAEQIAQIGSWSLDLQSTTVTWSNELYRMFGVKKSELEHRLESVMEFIHREDQGFVRRVVEEAVKTLEPFNFYFRLIRPDGEERIIHARGAILTNELGKAVRMYGAAQDVTERKKAENELQLAYQRLSYHVENTPLAVIEWDNDLCIKRWSKRAEEMFGWKASEVLGKSGYDPAFLFIHKEDRHGVDEIVEQLIKGRVDRNQIRNRIFTKDGKIIYSEWYNSALRDEQGNVITILSLIHNVTEQKIAEEQIRQSEAHLAEAQRVAKMGSWDLDLKTDKISWSEEIYHVFGIDKHTFGETQSSFLHLVNEEDRELVRQANRHTVQTGEPFTIEFHITTPKGERRAIQEHGYGQTDEHGKVVRLVGTAQDITERKKAEESLQRSYEEIRRLNEHLQKIREEERTSIAREIHDELGQYLTVLKMDVGILNKKLPDAEDIVQRKLQGLSENIDKVVHSVRRIASELRPTILDELGLAAAIAWHLEEFEKHSGIKTHFVEPEEEPDLPEAVKTNLFRIVQESLTNVARHSKATDVKIDLLPSDGHLILTIMDNGIGLAPDVISQKKTMGILGMKERTAIIGGKYDIQSTPGKGTQISVRVPLGTKPDVV